MANWKLALVIWLVASVTVAGAAVVAILASPSLASQAATLIPIAVAVSFAIAYVASLVIARQINDAR